MGAGSLTPAFIIFIIIIRNNTMTILEKVRARDNRRMAESTSGYIMWERPLVKLLFVAPHAYNRVVEAVFDALGRHDERTEDRVALDVIYHKVDVRSNKALLESAARNAA